MVQIMKETANIWEYKVGINAINVFVKMSNLHKIVRSDRIGFMMKNSIINLKSVHSNEDMLSGYANENNLLHAVKRLVGHLIKM